MFLSKKSPLIHVIDLRCIILIYTYIFFLYSILLLTFLETLIINLPRSSQSLLPKLKKEQEMISKQIRVFNLYVIKQFVFFVVCINGVVHIIKWERVRVTETYKVKTAVFQVTLCSFTFMAFCP